jgi:hypothetical protein
VGFFSQECIECGDSVIAPYDMPKGMEWQNRAVCITPEGDIMSGLYDGYGNVGAGYDRYDIGENNTVYHWACWEAAGNPTRYRGPSDRAGDQGYFYDRTAETCARKWVLA